MSQSTQSRFKSGVIALIATAGLGVGTAGTAAATTFNTGIPSSWTGEGNYGTSAANGVVTNSPVTGSTRYGWVSTEGGVSGVSLEGVGGSGSATTGSVLRSNVFSANSGDELAFYFNFVTSDGAGYADYAWARLLTASLDEVALLFTARTAPSGSIVPGFSMPTPNVTLNPTDVPIIGGAPVWAPLGESSNSCYAAGCGYTGWILSSYEVALEGNYILEFGVTNWSDTAYQTGLAFDGVTIGGVSISPVPEPTVLALLGIGLAGLGIARRRRG